MYGQYSFLCNDIYIYVYLFCSSTFHYHKSLESNMKKFLDILTMTIFLRMLLIKGIVKWEIFVS